MSLFHHIHFSAIDPLGDGLAEEIAAEQAEAEHFELDDQLDGQLAESWEAIVDDARKDPDFVDLLHSMDE